MSRLPVAPSGSGRTCQGTVPSLNRNHCFDCVTSPGKEAGRLLPPTTVPRFSFESRQGQWPAKNIATPNQCVQAYFQRQHNWRRVCLCGLGQTERFRTSGLATTVCTHTARLSICLLVSLSVREQKAQALRTIQRAML